jgi:hypothetical protein
MKLKKCFQVYGGSPAPVAHGAGGPSRIGVAFCPEEC